MPRFPSREWADEYVRQLNANTGYRDAGMGWEGDITLCVEKDQTLAASWYIYLDLHHGSCWGYEVFVEGDDVPDSEFVYSGPFGNWRRLIGGEIEPIQGLLTGKFRLKGPVMKVLRYSRAAKEMVNTAKLVDTEF